MSGTTIHINGSNNDSNLVLESANASISDSNENSNDSLEVNKNPLLTIDQERVAPTLTLWKNFTGQHAKIQNSNIMQGKWATSGKITTIKVKDLRATVTTDGNYKPGNPVYDIFNRMTDDVVIPDLLAFCPPTLGQFLTLTMPGVGSQYRLKDGTYAADNDHLITLFENIQNVYNIERTLGHDLLDGRLTWGTWSPTVQPQAAAELVAKAPINNIVDVWIKNIATSVNNLTKLFIDQKEGLFFRYYCWGLTRYHLKKASTLRGAAYNMYVFNQDTNAAIVLENLYTGEDVQYRTEDANGNTVNFGASWDTSAPDVVSTDPVRTAARLVTGEGNSRETYYNFYNTGPAGGIYSSVLDNDVYLSNASTWTYMWANADLPITATMLNDHSIQIPFEIYAFAEQVKGMRIMQNPKLTTEIKTAGDTLEAAQKDYNDGKEGGLDALVAASAAYDNLSGY